MIIICGGAVWHFADMSRQAEGVRSSSKADMKATDEHPRVRVGDPDLKRDHLYCVRLRPPSGRPLSLKSISLRPSPHFLGIAPSVVKDRAPHNTPKSFSTAGPTPTIGSLLPTIAKTVPFLQLWAKNQWAHRRGHELFTMSNYYVPN